MPTCARSASASEHRLHGAHADVVPRRRHAARREPARAPPGAARALARRAPRTVRQGGIRSRSAVRDAAPHRSLAAGADQRIAVPSLPLPRRAPQPPPPDRRHRDNARGRRGGARTLPASLPSRVPRAPGGAARHRASSTATSRPTSARLAASMYGESSLVDRRRRRLRGARRPASRGACGGAGEPRRGGSRA